MNELRRIYATPLGPMEAVTNGVALTAFEFDAAPAATPAPEARCRVLDDLGEWLTRYFAGENVPFAHPLAPQGTPFQRDVWNALLRIPYGATASYAAIARAVGRPAAVRAVGAANGRNPIAIIVPCHRVIGADGTLTGYAGGLDRKRALLALEQRAGFALVA